MQNVLQQFDTVAASEKGAWLHLCIPGTEELAYADPPHNTQPLRIRVKGPDSDTWVSYVRKSMRQKEDKRTVEEISREDSQLFACMTLDWEGIPDDDGGELECSFENAVKLYINYKDIRLQVMRFILDQENFTGARPSD